MKRHPSRLSFVLLGLALIALLLLGSGPLSVSADTAGIYDAQWSDGFESYTACPSPCDDSAAETNTDLYFPPAPWYHSGLKDSFVFTDRPHTGTKMLKAHGLNHTFGGSVAYREVGNYPPFEIDFWAQSTGDENLLPTAGHMKTVGLELATGPDFHTNHRGLLAFTVQDLNNDGLSREIWGGFFESDEDPATNGVYLGEWTGDTYHHINVKYEPVSGDATKVQITWTVDGGAPASKVYDVNWYENELDYVGLWAGGGQVWFDDITVTSSTDVFNFVTPGAPEYDNVVFSPFVAMQ